MSKMKIVVVLLLVAAGSRGVGDWHGKEERIDSDEVKK